MGLRTFILSVILSVFHCNAQKNVSVWKNYITAKKQNTEPILPDFSYAGYSYSNEAIPRVDYKIFDITKYGAIPNDSISDKRAIKKAIAAASENGEGIIYFPLGIYFINTKDDDLNPLKIHSSKLVFRGEKKENSSSTLFFVRDLPPENPEKIWTSPYAIITNTKLKSEFLAKITENAKRETFSVKVDNPKNIKVGDWVILKMESNNHALIDYDLAPLKPHSSWETILNKGVKINEKHKVKTIKNNTITFEEPIHYDVNKTYKWTLSSFPHLHHVGFENLSFKGNWTKEFKHHRSAQDDGGWSILKLADVVNSWIKDCVFENINRAVSISNAASSTALNITIKGNIGHNSISVGGGSTGVLLAKIKDLTGMHHAAGVGGGSTTGTVIWRSSYPEHSAFESHASQPRCTLFDNVEGGFFAGRAGGARKNLPNHGRYLVLWNFKETDEAEPNFRFVARDTWYWKIVPPIIVGFHGSGTTFKEDEVQILESLGTPVKPESLFEAQLKLRLGKLPNWIVNEKLNIN